MNLSPQGTYLLRWRGRQEGPLPLVTVRERLEAGEIGRLHEIQVDGRWVTLDEFLRQNDDRERATREAVARRAREEQARHEAGARENELEDARQENTRLADELEAARRDQTRRPETASAFMATPGEHSPPTPVAPDRGMSGMAIAAFVLATLNFVPFAISATLKTPAVLTFLLILTFTATVSAIVFGHVALGTIGRTPGMRGRGLALAALWITYVLLGLAVLVGFIFGVVFSIPKH